MDVIRRPWKIKGEYKMTLQKFAAMSALVVFSSTAVLNTVALAADGGTKTSNGVVKFVPNEDPTNPVDPTDPEKPVSPIDPTDPEGKPEPGTPGPLSIDFASSLDFGTQKISSTDETYKAAPQEAMKAGEKVTVPNYVQVTDNRGTLSGWTLEVQQMGQFKSDKNDLTGAAVTFENGKVNSISESERPTSSESFTLDPETNALSGVMSAAQNQGSGTTVNAFGDAATMGDSISLSVPGKTTKYATEYRTVFNWVLTDAPGK